MKRFGVLFLLLILSLNANSFAGEKPKVKKTKEVKNKVSPKELQAELIAQIKKSQADIKLDELIQGTLGEHYRRANVYDFYPLELKKPDAKGLNEAEKIKMMDFYSYSRRDLEKISGSKLLKAYAYNFDLDKANIRDTAVIVFNEKKNQVELAVINKDETLLLEKFSPGYLEPFNQGGFPIMAIYNSGKKRKYLKSPAIRIEGFEEGSYLLYYDTANKSWQKLMLSEASASSG